MVPFRSEWPNSFQLAEIDLRNNPKMVPTSMIPSRETCEVGEIIVERVPIDVIDVVSFWDGTVGGFPDFDVEVMDAILEVLASTLVVGIVSSALGIGVSSEDNAVELDAFGYNPSFWHTLIISPYLSVSRAFHSLLAQMG